MDEGAGIHFLGLLPKYLQQECIISQPGGQGVQDQGFVAEIPSEQVREHLLQTSQALDREHLHELGGKGKVINIYWLLYLEPSGMLVNVYQQQSGW